MLVIEGLSTAFGDGVDAAGGTFDESVVIQNAHSFADVVITFLYIVADHLWRCVSVFIEPFKNCKIGCSCEPHLVSR